MSNPGMQEAAASALQASGQPGGAPPQQQPAPQQGGGLKEFAEAFARCEQTHQCTPQDKQILQAGLPKLIQMVQMVQKILQAPMPQQGGAPQQ